MQSYVKPVMRAMDADAGSCGCNFHFNETPRECSTPILPPTGGGPCVSVDAGEFQVGSDFTLAPIGSNTVLRVGDGGAQVTPLANTGLPGTQPISFGIPVGTRGIYVDVTAGQRPAVKLGPEVGAAVGGNEVIVVLP